MKERLESKLLVLESNFLVTSCDLLESIIYIR